MYDMAIYSALQTMNLNSPNRRPHSTHDRARTVYKPAPPSPILPLSDPRIAPTRGRLLHSVCVLSPRDSNFKFTART